MQMMQLNISPELGRRALLAAQRLKVQAPVLNPFPGLEKFSRMLAWQDGETALMLLLSHMRQEIAEHGPTTMDARSISIVNRCLDELEAHVKEHGVCEETRAVIDRCQATLHRRHAAIVATEGR